MSMFNNWNGPGGGGVRTLPGEDVLMDLQNWLFQVKANLEAHIQQTAASGTPHALNTVLNSITDLQNTLGATANAGIRGTVSGLTNDVNTLKGTGTGSVSSTATSIANQSVSSHNAAADAHSTTIGATIQTLKNSIDTAVTGLTTVLSTTTFKKAATFNEAVTLDKTLAVTGATTLGGDVTVAAGKKITVPDIDATKIDTDYITAQYMQISAKLATLRAIIGKDGIRFDDWKELHFAKTTISNYGTGHPASVCIIGKITDTNTERIPAASDSDTSGALVNPLQSGVSYHDSVMSASVYLKYTDSIVWDAHLAITAGYKDGDNNVRARGAISAVYDISKKEAGAFVDPPPIQFGLYHGTNDTGIYLGVSWDNLVQVDHKIQVNGINIDTSKRPIGTVTEICVATGRKEHGFTTTNLDTDGDLSATSKLIVDHVEDWEGHEYINVSENPPDKQIIFGHNEHDTIITGSEQRPTYRDPDGNDKHFAMFEDLAKGVVEEGSVFFFAYAPDRDDTKSPSMNSDDPDQDAVFKSYLPSSLPIKVGSSGNKLFTYDDYLELKNGLDGLDPTGVLSANYFTCMVLQYRSSRGVVSDGNGGYIKPPDYGIALYYSMTVDPTTYQITYTRANPNSAPEGTGTTTNTNISDWKDSFDPEKQLAFQWHIRFMSDDSPVTPNADKFYHQADVLWLPFVEDPPGGIRVNTVNLVLEDYYDIPEVDLIAHQLRTIGTMQPDFLAEMETMPSPLESESVNCVAGLVPDPSHMLRRPLVAPALLSGGSWDDVQGLPTRMNARILDGGQWDAAGSNYQNDITTLRTYFTNVIAKLWHGELANLVNLPANGIGPRIQQYVLKYITDAAFASTADGTNTGGKRLFIYDDYTGTGVSRDIVIADSYSLGGCKFTWWDNTVVAPKVPNKGFTLTFPRIDDDPSNPPLEVDINLEEISVAWGQLDGTMGAQIDLDGGNPSATIRTPTAFDPLAGELTVAITDKVRQSLGTPADEQASIVAKTGVPILPGVGNGVVATPPTVSFASSIPTPWPTANKDYGVATLYNATNNSFEMVWKEIV